MLITLKGWVGVQWGQSYLMGRRCLFSLVWSPFQLWCNNKNTLWGRCFTIWTRLTPHLFLLGWLNLDLTLMLDQLRLAQGNESIAAIRTSSDLTGHLEDMGVGVFWLHCGAWCLIVRRLNLETTKRLLHQQVKILGYNFSAMFTCGSASLQLFTAVQIFLSFLVCHLLKQTSSQ